MSDWLPVSYLTAFENRSMVGCGGYWYLGKAELSRTNPKLQLGCATLSAFRTLRSLEQMRVRKWLAYVKRADCCSGKSRARQSTVVQHQPVQNLHVTYDG